MGITQIPEVERQHDGLGNPIGSLDGALDIHDADVHIVLINRHFIDFDSATENPSVAIVAGDTVILVADTTGFAVGNHIVIKDTGGDVREHHFDITAVVVNTSITVDRPIDIAYTTSATLEVVTLNMNVVGSLAAPLIYEVTPPSDEVWHIERVLLSITDQTAMDDALFGGITALTNGVVLIEDKTINQTITNWKTNAHMKEDMYDVNYSLKAPAGFYGLNGRFTFERMGAIIKLDGSVGDSLKIYIQDDLSGLDTFRMKAQGHTEGT
jgi:hypothetical protein